MQPHLEESINIFLINIQLPIAKLPVQIFFSFYSSFRDTVHIWRIRLSLRCLQFPILIYPENATFSSSTCYSIKTISFRPQKNNASLLFSFRFIVLSFSWLLAVRPPILQITLKIKSAVCVPLLKVCTRSAATGWSFNHQIKEISGRRWKTKPAERRRQHQPPSHSGKGDIWMCRSGLIEAPKGCHKSSGGLD